MTNLFQSRWLILASFLRVDLDFKSQLDCEVEISITNQVRIICCFRINREDFTENKKKINRHFVNKHTLLRCNSWSNRARNFK